jgi:hypothetical protein
MTRSSRSSGAAPTGRLFNSNRYAAVTSTMAFIVALGGGTAYAAGLVTSKDIKDGGVKRIDIADGAVNSQKIADGTLRRRDFKAGELPAGTPGPAGAQGPVGPQGPAGQPGASGPLDLVYVRTGPLSADPGVTEIYVFCPDGLSPTGGGLSEGGAGTTFSLHGSFPFDDNIFPPNSDSDTIPDNGWAVAINVEIDELSSFAVYAVCGSATTVDQEFVTVSQSGITTQKTSDGARIVVRPDSSKTPAN